MEFQFKKDVLLIYRCSDMIFLGEEVAFMIKDIKVFVADIDGTLAAKGEDLMPITRQALIKLHEQGVKIGLASGRPLDFNVINKSKDWDLGFEFDFCIGMNGGDLWSKKTGEFYHYNYLQPETIKEILNYIWDLDVNCIVYKNAYAHIKAKRIDDFLRDSQKRNNSYVEEGDIDYLSLDPTGKIEVHMKHKEYDVIMDRIKDHKSDAWTTVKTFDVTPETAFFLPEALRASLGDHVTLEFQSPLIDKGVALKKYCEMENISLENVIAFGDMQNDIGMIDTAGWGVCLLNGCDESKAVAQAITEYKCVEDGVGHYLEDHWFNKD